MLTLPYRARATRGFSLTELMVGISVVAILMVTALPNLTVFLNDRKVRNGADNILSGLNLARAEGIRRNAVVRFQLVSDLTAACTVASSGNVTLKTANAPSWIVSLDDPTGKCNIDPSETVAPRIIQKWTSQEGSKGVKWALNYIGPAATNYLGFSGLGRLSTVVPNSGPSPNVARFAVDGDPLIDVGTGATWTCMHTDATNGKIRCQRITVTNAGQIHMCDPAVASSSDPRYCAY